jgi:hypothetical protein
LGKIWPGVGVGGGGGVLEPPPQPTAKNRIRDPNKMPAILAMAINLVSKKAGDAGRANASMEFYAVGWPVNQSSGTSVTLDAKSLPDVCTFVNI